MIGVSTLITGRVFAARVALLMGAGVMVGSGGKPPQPTPPDLLPSIEGEWPRAAALYTPMAPVVFAGEKARAANARLAFFEGDNPTAKPFAFTGDTAARTRALTCLAAAVYYEAASEPREGKEAVAQVVLNRVRHPAYPASVCGVVFEGASLESGCQFSFACDGALLRRPDPAGWREASDVASAALDGKVAAAVGLSTHYHADYVLPYWAFRLRKSAQVGLHIFYRWPGGWGQPGAFRKRPSKSEPDVAALVAAAVMRRGAWPALDTGDARQWLALVRDPAAERQLRLALAEAAANDQPGKANADATARDPLAPLPDAQPATLARPKADLQVADRRALVVAEQAANDMAADFAAYSGLTLPERKLVALPLAESRASRCATEKAMAGKAWWIMRSPSDVTASSDRLVGSGALDGTLPGSLPLPVARQLAAAVFLRIADLRDDKRPAAPPRSDASLVGRFETLLRSFEQQRQRYPTLREFVPVLKQAIPVDWQVQESSSAAACELTAKPTASGPTIAKASPARVG